jgi:hypothetical protein
VSEATGDGRGISSGCAAAPGGLASAALRASIATTSAVIAPARSAAAIPATTCSWAIRRCSSSRARVPAASPCAVRAAAHQES